MATMPVCYSPIYKWPPSWLLHSSISIAKPAPKFKILVLNFIVENSLGRSRFGVREKGEKVERVLLKFCVREREVLLKF